ncbi:MAG: M23 family metallopeptidase, partial [Shewanella sp.]
TPRQYKIQQVTGIAKKIMQPDPKDVARAALDSQQVNRARAIDSDGMAFVSEFMWPLQGRISGVYGSQRVYNGEPGRPHFGVDIAAPRGTKAMAPADGVVTLAVPDMFYSGGTLIVDHGNGVNSTFLHLDKLLVNVGQSIKQGEVIALVGSTGRSTGPHLDWRLNWFNTRLDPATIVPAMTKPTVKSKAKS